MPTGYIEVYRLKAQGVFADLSSSTNPTTAAEDVKETVSQATRVVMSFDLAAGTATETPSSQRRALPGNGNYDVRSAYLVLASGSLAQSSTDYSTFTLNHLADSAATTKTAVAAYASSGTSCALGKCMPLTVTAANRIVSGGSLVVDLTKTGAGQTNGVSAVTIELARMND